MKSISKIALIIFSILGFILVKKLLIPNKYGRIILLNGTSSAGKSAILEELNKIDSSFYILKVDDWWPPVMKAKAKELGWDENSQMDPWMYLYHYMAKKTGIWYFATEMREILFRDSASFYQLACDVALRGQDVIIDTVLEYEREYKEFDTFFANKDMVVKKILVYCPLDILLHRVEQRNASGNPEEQRTVFQSFEQFPAIFKVQEHADEQVVDTVQSSVIKQTLDEAIAQLKKHGIPDPSLPRLEEFREKFIARFKLDEQKEIKLVPIHSYQLILNSRTETPAKMAQDIVRYIASLITQK